MKLPKSQPNVTPRTLKNELNRFWSSQGRKLQLVTSDLRIGVMGGVLGPHNRRHNRSKSRFHYEDGSGIWGHYVTDLRLQYDLF
ncbi:hypothetical protein L1987_80580 [Smallanthus sonchifolius]|uniref:Uncharacterized protein n=1 Tax=Smallanthus sonchifolius TaxID=185202 RepID=A0ACB8YP57_9ASTR|nr:hypothetical protein L1987_80580 [Smallanthus sonchifolius]